MTVIELSDDQAAALKAKAAAQGLTLEQWFKELAPPHHDVGKEQNLVEFFAPRCWLAWTWISKEAGIAAETSMCELAMKLQHSIVQLHEILLTRLLKRTSCLTLSHHHPARPLSSV